MTRTSMILPPEHRQRLAIGYSRRRLEGTRQLSPFSDLKGLTPAGGMSSMVEDLARFAALPFRDGQADGTQIVRGHMLRDMHRVHWLDADWTRGWGLEFMLRRQESRALVEHGGMVMLTPQIPKLDPAWQTYVGKYRNRWGDLQVLVWNGTLVLISPTELDPQRSIAMLVPKRERRFTLTGDDGFMELGAPVVFELGPDGRVARMKIGEDSMYPAE